MRRWAIAAMSIGIAVAADLGYTAPATVGAGLAVLGVLLFTRTVQAARRA